MQPIMPHLGSVSTVLSPAIIVGSLLLALVLVGAVATLLFRVILGGGSRRGTTAEDMRIVQEVHAHLAEIEKRVEALETILLDRIKRG